MWTVGSGNIYRIKANDTLEGYSSFPGIRWPNFVNDFGAGAGGNMIPKIEDYITIDEVDVKFDYKLERTLQRSYAVSLRTTSNLAMTLSL
jgi:hypothetical protein